jgi:hypothetical protein
MVLIKISVMPEPDSRSPLKAVPVRLPGQSVQDRINVLLDDVFTTNLVVVVITGVMLMTALIQYVFRMPPDRLVVVTALYFVGSLIYALPKMRRAAREAKALKLGRDGERAVAEYLDTLKNEDCRVLHDLVGDNFNLDHVLISRHGIYTVETKTISKPASGDAKVIYDGEQITVGGFKPDRDPITQAKAQASWLRTLLKDMTGREFAVRPVVVYPGWYVSRTNQGKGKDVWVLEPKALGKFIGNEPAQLSSSDIALVTHALKRHSRAG